MWTHPWPLVMKNRSLLLFQAISFTSKLYCSSDLILYVRASIKLTKSSLFPTAIVSPFGDQLMFMFSPFVLIVEMHFWTRASHIRMVLSPLAVDKRSGCVLCQQSWSTEPPCPLKVISLFYTKIAVISIFLLVTTYAVLI